MFILASKLFNIQPEILALLITPFATELPEIINSIIWLKQGKDELAIANILGAIVFQSSILFALGLILTPWHFSNLLLLNTLLTICCSFLFVISILINKKLKLVSLLFCGTFYIAYIIFVFNT